MTNIANLEEQTPAPLFDWRAHLDVHPAAEAFPLMKDEDPAAFATFVADIKANGLQTPIVTWWSEDHCPFLLDGRNRLDSLAQLGLLFETADHHLGLRTWLVKAAKWVKSSGERIEFQHFHGGDPYAIALYLNVHRRHLTSEQKRDLIAKVLKARPETSNLQIAKEVKADDKTVGKVRAELEARSEIPNVPKRTDSKGRRQPARRSSDPKHKCWQCGVRAPVGEVQEHHYAAYEDADVWLHPSCVAAFEAKEAEVEQDREHDRDLGAKNDGNEHDRDLGAQNDGNEHDRDAAPAPAEPTPGHATVAAAAVNQLGSAELQSFLDQLSPAHKRAFEQKLGARNSDNTNVEIATLAGECTALLAHPKQHIDDIYKKLARIKRLAGGKGKGRSKSPGKSNAHLDLNAFDRGMGLPRA